MTKPLKTVIVGFGKIAAGYARDPVMAHHYPFATHAQVLSVHPSFSWEAVVDPAEDALRDARQRWGVPFAVRSVEELLDHYEPEVAVLATPPEARLALVDLLPNLRAVVVEKPLGLNISEARQFLDLCARRGIQVQVNYWRRADQTFRRLAEGELRGMIGGIQSVFALYGNGLLNNGSHLVDMVRLLCGEVDVVQAVAGAVPYPAGPIAGDVNIPFTMLLQNGATVAVHPLRFEHYREVGLDIWGESGRLCILQEGLGIHVFPIGKNRGMQGQREIASDRPCPVESTVGHALYRLYDNLAAAVWDGAPLWSPGESAWRTENVLAGVIESMRCGGNPIRLPDSLLVPPNGGGC